MNQKVAPQERWIKGMCILYIWQHSTVFDMQVEIAVCTWARVCISPINFALGLESNGLRNVRSDCTQAHNEFLSSYYCSVRRKQGSRPTVIAAFFLNMRRQLNPTSRAFKLDGEKRGPPPLTINATNALHSDCPLLANLQSHLKIFRHPQRGKFM